MFSRLFAWFETQLSPFPESEPTLPPRSLLAFVWAGTEGMRRYIFALALLTSCIAGFEAWLIALLGKIVDRLGPLESARLWADQGGSLMLMAAVLMGSTLLVGLQTTLKHQTLLSNFAMRLRWNFHRLMLGQSLSFYQDDFAGRIATKVMQTALAVRQTVLTLTDVMVFMGVYFLSMVALAGGFDGWLVLPFMAWLAGYVAALFFFVPRLGSSAKAQADARSLMTGRVTDAYTNIATVKLFSHTQREAGFARSAMQEFLHTAYGQMRLASLFEIVNHALSMALIVGVAGTGLWLWSGGHIGVGSVTAATAMALRLNGMSHWIMWEMSGLFENIGTVQDGLNTLSRPQTVVDAPHAVALVVPRGEVRFEAVDFGYASTRKVIADFALTVRPGEKIGLIGRSGSGKSTLVNLLLRFYDLEAGRILIDGQDIAHVTQDSLRRHIGMVTQDTSLLHRSLRDNILYGRPDATQADVERAAAQAEAQDFIAGLSDPKGRTGYDAHVGERGVKLSGGQRQRIAIARVMLKDAPILLLDEATSALDSEVEAAIQASLNTLMHGKTVIAIAHRLSTIAAMDRLIVIDQGRIVEMGDHRALLAQDGLYARLWAHQSGGFLAEDAGEEGEFSFTNRLGT